MCFQHTHNFMYIVYKVHLIIIKLIDIKSPMISRVEHFIWEIKFRTQFWIVKKNNWAAPFQKHFQLEIQKIFCVKIYTFT